MQISVIIPMFNAETTIYRCISSILNSTFKNIEIIVVDDGSTDDCVNIVKTIDDNRIILLQKENGGPSSARNLGLTFSKGTYVMFIDADDYIEPNMIENLYNHRKENCLVSVRHCDIYDKNINLIECEKEYFKDRFFKKVLEDELLGVIWGFLFEKSKLSNINFDVNTYFMEDTIFLFKYIIENDIKKVIYIDREFGTYYYVQNINSITNKKNNTLDKIKKIDYSMEKIKDVLGNKYYDLIEEKRITLYEKELRYINSLKEVNIFFNIIGDRKFQSRKKRNKLFCYLINKRKTNSIVIYYMIRNVIKNLIKNKGVVKDEKNRNLNIS